MDPQPLQKSRAQLTASLSALSQAIAKDIQAQLLAAPAGSPLRTAALTLHKDERVGATFEVWTDLLSRRAAVLWVLKSVYVRVLEDRGLLVPKRIVDPESHALFSRLAPDLGDTAYLRWCYADLARPESGLAELFVPQPAELTLPSNELSRRLIDFWRDRDPDTGKLRFTFEDERFDGRDGRLMGDLYQDLDPVVKERYALLQTPDFVLDFILDETLTPAIAEFGIDKVRVIDPACGSGHFLLGAFNRLVDGLCEKAGLEKPTRPIVEDALSRVVGIDLNDYACALARTRLLMTAVERLELHDLSQAKDLRPQIYLADALDQLEDVQGELFASASAESPLAALSHEDNRKRLKRVLAPGFHAVVGNPPYITEKDKTKKDYHRGKVGREPRYRSAYREYSLASPFTERAFQLASQGGFIGFITSNNFMKREFGKALIEEVLAKHKLTKVVDTSGAFIPGHGTPTVILLGRRSPPGSEPVHAIMGKRGEPGTPEEPARGLVWQAILAANRDANFENEFVSAAMTDRAVFSKHPWSLRGGGAADVKLEIETAATRRLEDLRPSIGFGAISGEDNVFLAPRGALARHRIEQSHTRPLVPGEAIRDWAIDTQTEMVWPNNEIGERLATDEIRDVLRYFWPYKAMLRERRVFSNPIESRGIPWWAVREVYVDRFRTPLSIAFAFVATHNHFVLDRGGKVFKQSAPVIKLPESATEDDHLALLGLLNSSTACFWMKQVFHCKGGQGINEGAKSEGWEQFYEFDSTKLKPFPLPRAQSTVDLARAIDNTARDRPSVASVLTRTAWSSAADLQRVLTQRRTQDMALLQQMVGWQEELDWSCYEAFGLVDHVDALSHQLAPPIRPTQRPMELLHAARDAEIRASRDTGDETVDQPTAWFERHGWTPETDLTDVPPDYAAIVRRRLDLIASTPALELIETPMYKRRWYKPDYAAEEQAALEAWLLDRLEAWAGTRTSAFTADDAASALAQDAQLLAVLEVRTNRRDFDLASGLSTRLMSESVPNQKMHRYKPSGLIKRAAWEETRRLQHEEDQGKSVTPPVPPKYVGADFLKAEYFAHRGPLDVPKERFVALTEVPRQPTEPPLYLWAGLTPRQRASALLDLDETLAEAGVPVPDRHGLLHAIWALLPYVAWDSKDAAEEIRSVLELEVGKDGITDDLLQAWATRFPPGRPRKKKNA